MIEGSPNRQRRTLPDGSLDLRPRTNIRLGTFDAIRVLMEGLEARDYQGQLLSGNELADLLGTPRDPNGLPNTTAFVNDCMSVDEFDSVRVLPRDQRIQAMATAFNALGILFPHWPTR